jgi:membrane-bound inhibitor of C-type lysozyme
MARNRVRAALLLLIPATVPAHGALGLVASDPVVYVCAKEERMVARYFRLDDDSLHFVKLQVPGGREFTLPNVVSASGARYTDERELVWWTKGDTAFAESRDPDGKWTVTAKDCRRVEPRK